MGVAKFHREVLLQAKALVSAVGGTCRIVHGHGGHGKLVISIDGKERQTTLSNTPRSADNTIRMKITDVRRILREMGR